MTLGASAPLFPAVGVDGLVSLDDVRAAAVRVQDLIVRTPLLASPEASERVGHEVRFKCESLQRFRIIQDSRGFELRPPASS